MISSKLKLLVISAIIVISLSFINYTNGSPIDSQIITEPEPGQEYVFVQTSQSGARPIKRKDKKTVSESKTEDIEHFETGHKIPTFLTFQEKENIGTSKVKRAAAEIPGAIKIDASKLIEKYRDILESTTKQNTDVDSTTTNVILTTGGPSTRRSFEIVHGKNKEGGIHEAGSVNSDAKLTGSGSDKQTSRIQIKKGPNGQDYEYEYVYYYYDEEEPSTGKELSKTKEEKITNAHDGPARNSITPSTSIRGNSNKSRYQTIDRSNTNTNLNAEPASNEVVPTTSKSLAKSRSRQVPSDEDVIAEERLPPNTRFPPRSRNLSTTPSSTSTTAALPDEHKPHIRSRQRGKPAIQDQTEEPATVPSQQTSRQRTRPNVKRPSLELVDSASFKTHASDASVSQYKELSASRDELSQAKLLGESDAQTATSRSFDTADGIPRTQSLDDDDRERFESKEEKLFDSSTTENAIISTTLTDEMAAAMDKVALDLYAILQGTQNMIQEDDNSSTDNSDSVATTELGSSATEEGTYSTTEILTEEPTTPSTITTTTTTTQATTTTTTTEPSTPPLPGRGRFRGRTTASSRFRQSTSSSTTEASNEVTSKGSRFSPGRTSFGGRNRINSRTSTEKSVENGEITKESASVNNNARPSIGGNRSRFGSTRGRTSTTTTTTAPNSDSINSVSSPVRPSLTRPRPNFNLRRRGGPSSTTEASTSTAKSGDLEESSTETPESSSTTVRSVRPRISGAARPLRPGPRININSRGRIGAVTTTPSSTTAANAADDNEKVASEEVSNVESESNESSETTPTSTTTENALQRLRNRARINVSANKPKAPQTPAPVARRTNPLISRRKPINSQSESTTESHSSEESSSEDKVQNEVTENPLIEETNSEQPVEVSPVSSTTEARGLNGLLAGRRRLNRRPGTIL